MAIFGSALGLLKPVGTVAGVVLPIGLARSGYNRRVQERQNPILAAGMEGVNAAMQLLLPLPTQIALFGVVPLARAGAAAVLGRVHEHNNYIRAARTPFSHRFEHSQMTAAAQSRGLQAIGASFGQAQAASQAAQMAARYAR
jgi:hypothetical protein